jgi:hypothetical protein
LLQDHSASPDPDPRELERRLRTVTGGHCQNCRRQFPSAQLRMVRVDPTLADVQSANFGYLMSNVLLLCDGCRAERDTVSQS